MAGCYKQLGKKPEAIKCYQRAESNNDREGIALTELARLFREENDRAQARVRVDPNPNPNTNPNPNPNPNPSPNPNPDPNPNKGGALLPRDAQAARAAGGERRDAGGAPLPRVLLQGHGRAAGGAAALQPAARHRRPGARVAEGVVVLPDRTHGHNVVANTHA